LNPNPIPSTIIMPTPSIIDVRSALAKKKKSFVCLLQLATR
jgi:hypothetical protein